MVFWLGVESECSFLGISILTILYKSMISTFLSSELDKTIFSIVVISVFLLICFLTGIMIHEIFKKLYRKKEYTDSRKFYKRLFIKTDTGSIIDKLFEIDSIIGNDYKKRNYIDKAIEFARTKEIDPKIIDPKVIDTPEVSRKAFAHYFNSHCIYYNRINGHNKITEKLRDIEGLASTLSMTFLFLTLFALFFTPIAIEIGANFIGFFIVSIAFSICSIVFDYITERTVKNRLKIQLAVYSELKDKEQQKNISC